MNRSQRSMSFCRCKDLQVSVVGSYECESVGHIESLLLDVGPTPLPKDLTLGVVSAPTANPGRSSLGESAPVLNEP
jgi:hypothetical protein